MSIIRFAAASLVAIACSSTAADDSELARELRFEAGTQDGQATGWGAQPDSIRFDTETVHAGKGALRIHSDADGDPDLAALTRSIPVTFQGQFLDLRGYLRTRDVVGRAGLWVRIEGAGGVLAFDDMQDRPVEGTTAWTEYNVRLPVAADAETIVFGALLSGKGTVWVDDLSLWVDGMPLAEAPMREVETTVLDTDTRFDAGSGIELARLTDLQIDHLARLGRVWGFVKYHHPAVASGDYHWDYELFDVMPVVLAAEHSAAANSALASWLARIGVPDTCDPCATPPDDAHLSSPLDWIDDKVLLGERLSHQLRQIHANRFTGLVQFHARPIPGAGNPLFPNELPYRSWQPPDAGGRLLALFRFWNIIQYWFPYRDQIDGDWLNALHDLLPRFAAADNWDAYRLALFELITRIGDGHAILWSELVVVPPTGECYLPFALRWIEDRPVITNFAEDFDATRANLAIGDVIAAIDGTPVEDLVQARRQYYSGSNEPARLRLIAELMPRGECAEVRLTIERNGRPRELTLARDHRQATDPVPHDRPGDAFQRLSEEIAYLKASASDVEQVDAYLAGARGTRGLVIDIRGYPREFPLYALGPRLIDEPTPFARVTLPDFQNPGAFTWSEAVVLQPEEPGYEGSVVILVDDASKSASEFMAMAFRASPRATVIGSQTAGADGNISTIPLPGGLRVAISGLGVFYPDRAPTQRIGIVPDIVVAPTIEGVATGRDEVLERAVRHILGEDATEEEVLVILR